MATVDTPSIKQIPYVLSLIICDQVLTQPETGKQAILGCFGSIGAWAFPALHPTMTVFAEMTDGVGEIDLTLKIVSADSEATLFESKRSVEFQAPLAVVSTRWVVEGLVFPEQGEYRVQLLANHDFLLERRFVVVPMNVEER